MADTKEIIKDLDRYIHLIDCKIACITEKMKNAKAEVERDLMDILKRKRISPELQEDILQTFDRNRLIRLKTEGLRHCINELKELKNQFNFKKNFLLNAV